MLLRDLDNVIRFFGVRSSVVQALSELSLPKTHPVDFFHISLGSQYMKIAGTTIGPTVQFNICFIIPLNGQQSALLFSSVFVLLSL